MFLPALFSRHRDAAVTCSKEFRQRRGLIMPMQLSWNLNE